MPSSRCLDVSQTGAVRILLKLVLDCEPDAAWRAIRSPAGLTAVSAPLTVFTSREQNGFPPLWSAGVHPVGVKAAGLVPLGEQTIDISFPDAPEGVRMMRDTGRGLTGPLAVVTYWQHTMAIAAAPGGGTLYRDRLVFRAGRATVLLWPLYWGFWQWRGRRIRLLARGWRA